MSVVRIICRDLRKLRLLCKLHKIWSVDSQDNHWNWCYQMSDFKAKMHQNRFRLGLRPRPRWRSLRRSPRPPSRLGGDRRLGRLHFRAFGIRLGFAIPSLCPWRGGAASVYVYCVNCTKFGQLILRIIIKIMLPPHVKIFRLKCTKIGTPPGPLAGLKGAYF